MSLPIAYAHRWAFSDFIYLWNRHLRQVAPAYHERFGRRCRSRQCEPRNAGRNSLAQRAALGKLGLEFECRRHESLSSENKSWVVLNSGLSEHGLELILEASCSMMLCLIRDVFRHSLPLRLADAERSVSFLPLKSTRCLAQPSRSVCLQFLHGFSQRHRLR